VVEVVEVFLTLRQVHMNFNTKYQPKALIEEADRIYRQALSEGFHPQFDELVDICRDQNLITEEIRILKLAVSFYTNAEIEEEERQAKLTRFKLRLTERKKEAKVLQLLNW